MGVSSFASPCSESGQDLVLVVYSWWCVLRTTEERLGVLGRDVPNRSVRISISGMG